MESFRDTTDGSAAMTMGEKWRLFACGHVSVLVVLAFIVWYQNERREVYGRVLHCRRTLLCSHTTYCLMYAVGEG